MAPNNSARCEDVEAPLPEPRPFRNHFSADEEAEFVMLVRERFSKARGFTLHASDNDRWMTDTKGNTYGLSDLSRHCKTVERSLWKNIIAEHLQNIEAAHRRSKEKRSQISFDDAAPLLAVRLHSGENYPGDERALVCRRVFPGIVATVVLDYPEMSGSISRELLHAWGVPEADVFERALQNVRAKAPLPIRRVTISGQTVYGVEDNVYWYTATHALLLEAYPESRSSYGRLFTIPNRHFLLFVPIRNTAILNIISATSEKNWELFREMPGPISPNWFWEDADGTVRVIESAIVGDPPQLRVTPPPEFVALLEKLPRPGRLSTWIQRTVSVVLVLAVAQILGHRAFISAAKSAWQRDDRTAIVEHATRARAIAILPGQRANAEYWMGIGEYRRSNYVQAERHEREAIRLQPTFVGSHVTLGAVLLARGDRNGAWQAANRAMELDPDYAWTQNLMGILLLDGNRAAEAVPYFQRAHALDAEQPIFSDNLANAERLMEQRLR